MTKKELQHFRKILLKQREEILVDMGQLRDISLADTTKEAAGNDATYSTHMADQGTDAQEREKAFFYASRDNKYLRHINEALERIDDCSYGSCIICGNDIPPQRLEAVPITRHCVPCKELENT